MKLSVVIPVYNGALTIRKLLETLQQEMDGVPYEIILVNDDSKDQSGDICEELAYIDPHINYVSLRNNFGEHSAVLCGLNISTGDYVVIIDDDFQNPPSEIKKLLKVAVVHNYDVVYSRYKKKRHNWFRNFGSRWNNFIASIVLDKPFSLYLSSFKIIKREVINEIIKYKGSAPYIDGLILSITSNIGSLEVDHFPRAMGKSNYTFSKLFSLYMSMLINHSIRPVRLLMVFGVSMLIIGITSFMLFLFTHIGDSSPSVSWKLFLLGSLIFTGLNVTVLSLIGEYMGKVFLHGNGTPQFVIRKTILNNGNGVSITVQDQNK